MRYLPIIGLEIHVQLKTASKMFCSCPNVGDDAPPNTSICSVCTGQPGALPALNEKAIELGVRTGLALNCVIPKESVFDRKNYFYPDLPKGYQISQFHLPIAEHGSLEIDIPNGTPPRTRVRVGITRAHLEEDAAKNTHAAGTDTADHATYVDYNRAGVPLLEIVSEPDLRTPQEAKAYLQEMRAILRTIGASDADMEKGQMRCDANISLLPVDENNMALQPNFNPKIEIKNLNSFRAVEKALAYEIKRQEELYATNTPPVGSTRGWDEDRGVTFEQRLKETFADYRYFREPDLPPQALDAIREQQAKRIPELPKAKQTRFMNEWGFSANDAAFFSLNEGWAEYAEHVMGELGTWLEATDTTGASGSELLAQKREALARLAGGWLTSRLAGILTEKNISISDLKISAEDFAEFLQLIYTGAINSANAQKLLLLMVETGMDPSHLLEEHNLGQNMNEDELREMITRLIEENPDKVAQIKAGKVAVIKWFVGSIMKATEGKANPETAEQMIQKLLTA